MKSIQIWSTVCFYYLFVCSYVRLFVCLFICLGIWNGTNETIVLELTLWFIYLCLKSFRFSGWCLLFPRFRFHFSSSFFLHFRSSFLANRSRQWVIFQTACTQNDILIYWIYLFHNCARYRITKQSIFEAPPLLSLSLSFAIHHKYDITLSTFLCMWMSVRALFVWMWVWVLHQWSVVHIQHRWICTNTQQVHWLPSTSSIEIIVIMRKQCFNNSNK